MKRRELEDRLASSDLEDCEEVWIAELSSYAMETHHRRLQVERWFEDRISLQNTSLTERLSHQYATKMAKIPIRPPTPPPAPPPVIKEDRRRQPTPPPMDIEDISEAHFSELDEPPIDMVDSFMASSIPAKRKSKGKQKAKPAASRDVLSDTDTDGEPFNKRDEVRRPEKKRRIDEDMASVDDGDMDSLGLPPLDEPKSTPISRHKGKGKQVERELSVDSVSVAGTPKRKKPSTKKKPQARALDALSTPGAGAASTGSASANPSPSASRMNSPVPQPSQPLIWEVQDVAPPMRRAKKVDDATMSKRIKSLEETQRKVWTNIARREVAKKVYKYQASGYQARLSQAERIAKLASLAVRKPYVKTPKANKDTQAKSKRLMREMQLFWKKNEKEERDVRKREQKEAQDRAKIEEEAREAARQSRKLEFLISQSEIYSHFVGSKLKTHELEGADTAVPVPVGAEMGDVDPATLQDINFDDEDTTNLHRHANRNAREVMNQARQRAQEFDSTSAQERQRIENGKAKPDAVNGDDQDMESEGGDAAAKPLVDLDSDELNFQNPTSLTGPLLITQPRMLMAQLKEYQLRGLNWLGTLYEQGINGILADEMGLGKKTIQSISLMAFLAEVHDIWGPFLVVAPASTLHNWQQEIARFVPGLKALPYWGNVKDRAVLRKFWSKKSISYNQDAPFHVVITSYQLVTQDQQYFQRVKWQYMILDEAQNIKNANSVRWKTLLGFQCRNRLLLTGTPIQNSMQELWALLHFIMPSLFDNHDEFNEWFSKDIESAAENKGSALNEHQLRRLHMILKPFMLRRIKRHVQNELGEKIEIDIFVDLSPRQRALYRALRANVSLTDLLAKARNINDAESARSLMNLVMQFRKVCNHPELFERADVVAPFSFARFGQSGPLCREGDVLQLPYSSQNPITYQVPRLLFSDGGMFEVPHEDSSDPSRSSPITKLMNIWSTDWMHRSLYDHEYSSSFSFLRFAGVSVSEAHESHVSSFVQRCLDGMQHQLAIEESGPYYSDPEFAAHSVASPFLLSATSKLLRLDSAPDSPSLASISHDGWTTSCLSRPGMKWYSPAVVAPPITMYCDDKASLEHNALFAEGGIEPLALYGLPSSLQGSQDACSAYQRMLPALPFDGLVGASSEDQLPSSHMHVPEAKRLIYDSAKLARLDSLLQELKTGDHRVLIYFQMTRMMDLMEEYLIYRQYKYLRLDGSSKLEDRRDMVTDWQTKPEIFVFLLSTRAGGLGINLTAADTVVFYDHDWNPSNDAQAMDRAHRLGQTRQVTVYRLITKGTIDERIVQMARVKKDVQDIVVGSKNFSDSAKPSDIVSLLLNDEQLANLDASQTGSISNDKAVAQTNGPKVNGDAARELWNEEEDYFFGNSGSATGQGTPGVGREEDASTPVTTTSKRGKKRKEGGTSTRGSGRGRGGPRKKRGGGAATGYVDESLARTA
ncbi:SNF2 family N-terminal domain-containing protein [Pterulicium gracile]|uniref:Chromatin-remodeling ATPase INO80 n=1 Tax=Pterulicium gracile TaxID=1884261 RepID=A0A5C3QX46_9AGAR|nr:SNF2 family N-terminal domain-containing protein [Pterula gracilis]